MKFKVLGLGACGTKVAIRLIEQNIVDIKDVVLINSTLKDTPEQYKDITIRISDGSQQGAAQERRRGKEMAIEAIKRGQLNLDGICDPDHQKAIIITSLSGGTGSGSSVVIAKYLKEVVGIPVEIYGCVGFSDESTRALRNTIEFCQDLEEEYIIQLIRNDAFLKDANGNRIKAEQMANEEIGKRILIGSGELIQESVQNIDDMDLLKLETTKGYKTVEYIPINDKIKSHEQFNQIIKEALDNTKSVESDNGGMKRLGMIFNLNKSSQEFIDYSYSSIRGRLGVPYEVYNHVESVDGMKEFIALIATGMKMPLEQIKKVYQEYQSQVDAVDTSSDQFFEQVRRMKGDKNDNMFDMDDKQLRQGDKEKFFDSFNEKVQQDKIVEDAKIERKPTTTAANFFNNVL